MAKVFGRFVSHIAGIIPERHNGELKSLKNFFGGTS